MRDSGNNLLKLIYLYKYRLWRDTKGRDPSSASFYAVMGLTAPSFLLYAVVIYMVTKIFSLETLFNSISRLGDGGIAVFTFLPPSLFAYTFSKLSFPGDSAENANISVEDYKKARLVYWLVTYLSFFTIIALPVFFGGL